MTYTTLISCSEAVRHLGEPDWCFIDCRFDLMRPAQGEAWYREGHLPGALYAHLDDDLSSPVTPHSGRHPLPDTDALCARLGAWGIGPATQVVVYDQDIGAYAARLWWLLRWLGHGRVALLDGGVREWQRLGLPLDTATVRREPFAFVPAPGALAVATDELVPLQQAGGVLLDARAAARYRGEVEPIDPVAGHIPGALNYPLTLNLDEQGLFKGAALLRAQFDSLLGTTPPGEVVHYCGSGVTACLNLLAMEHAGLPGSRLYPGSWSEWIRDPERGIGRG